MRSLFLLDPDVVFLNHGSFGACPRALMERADELRRRMEREPVQFMLKERPRLLDEARGRVARFVGASPEDLAFVPNATSGVNAVLRSLRLEPGDEILVTNQGYHACHNAARFVAQRSGAKVVEVALPFPLRSPEEVVVALHAAITERTKLALLDHVTSPTALVLPLEKIVPGLEARGVSTLIDGAHGPGMLDLDLDALGASYYTGNLHKWCCAPRGSAFLWVRPDRAADVHPSVISHGFDSTRARPALWEEFDWTGTSDPVPWLSVPAALDALDAMVEGGWPEVRRKNRDLALAARDLLCETLGVEAPAPDEMLGSMAAVPLPDAPEPPTDHFTPGPLAEALFSRHRIEVPIVPWPGGRARLVRVSAHLYNTLDDVRRLAAALLQELARERKPD